MSGYIDLDLDKMRDNASAKRTPFPHQMEAIDALNKTFSLPISGYKGTLLAIPTGGGKTFTAINWICRCILSRNIKVLRLAQSSDLLNQATQSFIQESSNYITYKKISQNSNVFSSTSHSNSENIKLSDDF